MGHACTKRVLQSYIRSWNEHKKTIHCHHVPVYSVLTQAATLSDCQSRCQHNPGHRELLKSRYAFPHAPKVAQLPLLSFACNRLIPDLSAWEVITFFGGVLRGVVHEMERIDSVIASLSIACSKSTVDFSLQWKNDIRKVQELKHIMINVYNRSIYVYCIQYVNHKR